VKRIVAFGALLFVLLPAAVGAARMPATLDVSAMKPFVVKGTHFKRGEGLWFDSGVVYLATTADNTVWAYNTGTESMEKLYDGVALGDRAPIKKVDNVTVSSSGDLFVCEDPGEIGIGIITPEREIARFLRVSGEGQVVPNTPTEDVQNEITGVIFDPSGSRMYFSAQRSFFTGVIYEITGPFRRDRIAPSDPPPLRVETAREQPLRDARRRGPRVALRLGRTATVTATLTARRGGRDVVLARRTLRRDLGPVIFHLQRTRTGRDVLRTRRRALTGTLRIVAVDAAGRRAEVTQPLRLA